MSTSALTVKAAALVVAALDDGHELIRALEAANVEVASWSKARADLFLRLSREETERTHFTSLYESAQDRLFRKVEPLEDDLEMWVTFLSSMAEESDSAEFLATLGLTVGDLGRLTRRWGARFDADSRLASRAAELAKNAQRRPTLTVRVGEPASLDVLHA